MLQWNSIRSKQKQEQYLQLLQKVSPLKERVKNYVSEHLVRKAKKLQYEKRKGTTGQSRCQKGATNSRKFKGLRT